MRGRLGLLVTKIRRKHMYPYFLNPDYTEEFRLQKGLIEIPRCRVQFQPWLGEPVKNTFGGKPIVMTEGEPMFAEMAVLNHFVKFGWQARWLQMTGRLGKEPFFIGEWTDDSYANQKDEPIEDKGVMDMLVRIADLNNRTYAGCWDILSWKDGNVVFTRVKRNNKDVITPAQIKWLAAGLAFSLTPDNFLLVQWDFNPRCA